MKILNQILSSISVAHKEAIKIVISSIRANSFDKTDREIQFDAQRLVDLIKGKQQVFTPILAIPLGLIDSDAHNQNMEGAFIDLKTLYVETAHIANVQNYQKTSIESSFNKARAAVYKLINDARVFVIRSRNPEYDDVKLVNFNIARNESATLPNAIVDLESRLLKLPEVAKIRKHIQRRDQKRTIATSKIVSSGQQGQLSSSFEPKLALDGKTETFWGELIYADEPLQTVYTKIGTAGTESTQEIINGPIVEYTLSYNKAEAINQIKILPFAPTEVRILDITYRPTSSSKISYSIGNFTLEESLDWIEYNFETIQAEKITITFAQESYREFIVNIPRHILFSTDFFLKLLRERKKNLQEIPDLDSISIGGNHEIYNEAIADLATLIEAKDIEKSPSTEIDLAGKIIMSIGETLAGFSPDLSSLLQDVTSYTETLPKEFLEEIESIIKYEYLIGAKEIQTNQIFYSPVATYESPKFDTASTVITAAIEVDEQHSTVKSLGGNMPQTATEWEVEFAPDRKLPIFPKNQIVDGLLPVVNERLKINPISRFSLSRFPAFISFASVRKNTELLIENIDYTIEWNGVLNNGKLKVLILEDAYDPASIYTINYMAASSAAEIDVLSHYKPKRVSSPDSFEGNDSDNKVELSFYPYINYGIINSDDFNTIDPISDFAYSEPTGAYGSGLGRLEIHPNWENSSGIIPDQYISGSNLLQLVTGSVTGGDYGSGNFDFLNTAYLTDPYKYYLKLGTYNKVYEVESFHNATGITLKNVPLFKTGVLGEEIPLEYLSGNVLDPNASWPIFVGDQTGFLNMPYTLHVVYTDGDEIFGFDNLVYRPIDLSVGGTKAKNITDYVNLEQPAFTVSESQDEEYEFIHDGKNIYFNQSIASSEILVDYKKIIDYIKVNCILRSSKIINPTVTPQVNEYRLLLNTSIL